MKSRYDFSRVILAKNGEAWHFRPVTPPISQPYICEAGAETDIAWDDDDAGCLSDAHWVLEHDEVRKAWLCDEHCLMAIAGIPTGMHLLDGMRYDRGDIVIHGSGYLPGQAETLALHSALSSALNG